MLWAVDLMIDGLQSLSILSPFAGRSEQVTVAQNCLQWTILPRFLLKMKISLE